MSSSSTIRPHGPRKLHRPALATSLEREAGERIHLVDVGVAPLGHLADPHLDAEDVQQHGDDARTVRFGAVALLVTSHPTPPARARRR